MKKLTKIKLINWHIFNNHAISIVDNTIITGENGHGKSTLLDAIYYVLSAGSGKFNQAANNNAKRTVETYVRGRTGHQGSEFIRNDDSLIGHIALEFYDDYDKNSFIIGTIINIPLKRDWFEFYKIDDAIINDEYYVKENVILDKKDVSASVKAKGKNIEFFDTKKKAKEMIKSSLGLPNEDTYIDLLSKAVAFKPIPDINSFVYEYLLEDDEIDINNLKNDMNNYREISRTLEIEKHKLKELEPLNKEILEYNQIEKQYNLYEYLKHDLKINYYSQQINRISKVVDDNTDLKFKLEQVIKQLDLDYRKQIDEVSGLKGNELIRLIDSKGKQVEELRIEIQTNENKIKKLEESFLKSKRILKDLNIKFDIPEKLDENSLSLMLNNLDKIRSDLDEVKKQENIENHKMQEKYTLLSDEIKEIKRVLGVLKTNKRIYKDSVSKLWSILETELNKKYINDKISIKPLCELIEINSEQEHWRDAIEGFLNTQRFDFIVDPKYFDDSARIYDNYKKDNKVHGVGVINTNKLVTNEQNLENSLASKIIAKNNYAQAVMNMIAGNVVCVDEAKDLKKYNNSISLSCMTYRNHTIRKINPKNYEMPFIGNKAIEIQIDKLTNRLKEQEIEFKKLESAVNNQNERIEKLSTVDFSNFNVDNYYEIQKNKTKQLEENLSEIEKLKQDDAWLNIEKLISDKQNECDHTMQKNDHNKEELGALKKQIEADKIENDQFKNQIKGLQPKENYHEIILTQEFKLAKNELLKNNSKDYKNAIGYLDAQERIIQGSIDRLKYSIENKMELYIKGFDVTQYIANIENKEAFKELYDKIKNQGIIDYQEKADLAYEKCYTRFQEDFLAKINEKIINAKELLIRLNKTLKETPFGFEEEIYEFAFGASKDSTFKDYYYIITSNQDYNKHNIFVDNLSEKNRMLLDELFSRLTSEEESEKNQKLVKQYTDYRKYMDYDIKVTNKYEKSYLFSEAGDEKSGGETQTPFYVIIASSFYQLTKNKNYPSPGVIVLLDEAFNNMDESRIHAFMSFYKQLKLQIIIAVPSLRAPTLVPYVETRISVIKIGDTVKTRFFEGNYYGN